MAWTLVPCLVALRAEFNALSPNRDKGADGSIGDSAHTSSSDHTPDEDSVVLRDHDADSKNEVHALDIDSSGPWPESFDTIIKRLVAREKREYESATTVGRLQYVIWNRRIASRSWGWTWRTHAGGDPHTNHAHFSARYTTAQENDTRPWGVEGDDMALTQDDLNDIADAVWQKSLGTTSTANRFGTQNQAASNYLLLGAIYGYDAQKAVGSNAAAEAARDANTASILAGMQSALASIAAANGALSPTQVADLTAQVRAAAEAAGSEATAAIAAKVDALREHLGDDAPISG
jgi:hypothetical protein